MLCLGFLAAAPQTKAAGTELLNVSSSPWFYLQDGTDQGTAWRALGFNASAAGWPSGNGLFGWETTAGVNYGVPGTLNGGGGGSMFNTEWARPSVSGFITIYARSTFNWVGSTAGLILNGTLRIDDGAIIYINGVEAYRYNMPADPITFTTQASGTGTEPIIVTGISFPGTAVVAGPNEIAVEIHQAGTGSSDVVFGLDLFGDVANPPVFVNALEPVDAAVVEGASHILIGTATGLPTPTYAWFKDSLPIASATGPTYTIASMSAGDAGNYYVEALNSAVTTPVRSRTAVITFVPDTTPPILLSALIRNNTNLFATFSEAMHPTTWDAFGISVYVKGGDPYEDALGYDPINPKPSISRGWLTNVPPSLVSNTWVWITSEPASPSVSYSLDVYAGSATDAHGIDTAVDFTVDVNTELVLIPYNSDWKYYQTTPATTDPLFGTTFYSDPAFNDSAWPSGPGVHAREDAPLWPAGATIGTQLLSAGNGGPQFTTYLRKTFTLPIPLASLSDVRMTFFYDDGCAIYLNGVEIARRSLAAGATFATAATSHDSDNTTDTVVLAGLVDGPNTLAVEVHDTSTGSSDLVFGAQIIALATSVTATDPTISNPLPATQTVAEGAPVSYSVTTTGFPPPAIQWYRNGVAIPLANTLIYSIPSAGGANAGTYTVVADNGSGNPATSAGAVLNVTIDTSSPVLQSAITVLALDTNQFVLEFNEALDPVTGGNPGNYAVALRGGGGDLTINLATLSVGGTRVTLDTSDRLPSQNYKVTITGVKDTSAAGNLINPNPTVANLWSEVIVLDATAATPWKYFDTFVAGDTVGLDGQAWNTAGFNDSAWETGAPLFWAQRSGTETTEIPVLTSYPTLNISNTTDSAGIPAVYFRTTFNFPHDPATTPVRLHYIVDDGLAIYFNGTEVHRDNMAAGPILFSTLATGGPTRENFFEPSVGVSGAALTQGAGNQIAVEVHQINLTSSDIVFALQVLIAQETVTPAAIITGVAINGSGNLIISFIGDNVYMQKAANLDTSPAGFSTIPGGPISTGTFDAGPVSAATKAFFRLSDTP